MNFFDRLHQQHFDQLFSLDEEGREAKAKLLREAGFPEEVVMDLCSPGIKVGMTFGGAKPIDVSNVVQRVLFHQRAGSVLLRVTRPPYDEAGHVEIAVLEVGPPSEQNLGRPASDASEQPEEPPSL
jgi:hypothetical protein